MFQSLKNPLILFPMTGRCVILAGLLAAGSAFGQAMEPRFYSNAPTGMNFVLGGYVYSTGGFSADPALNITDGDLKVHTPIAAYARSTGLFGRSAKFDVVVPFSFLDGTGKIDGVAKERSVDGFNDPSFRASINWIGAPALSLADFKDYQQRFILGTSLKVTAPLGQYDSSRLINIGQNRWSFAPEVGMSQTFGPLILELAGAVTLFTDNNDFNNGGKKTQEPLYSVQGHVVYTFPKGIWLAANATYYTGGRTSVNGVERADLLQNSRLGLTLALPVNKRNSVKLYASGGTSTRTGSDFNTYGAAWQYRWGGGL